jgi:class 3 adenylate cyclase
MAQWRPMNDVPPPLTSPAPSDALTAAREAARQHRWSEAFEDYARADAEGSLSGADLEAYALTAWFVARPGLQMEIKERAFKVYEADDQAPRAAYVALDVARGYNMVGKPAIAAAWARRAERILGPEGDGYAFGYLALARSEMASASGDIETALPLAEKAVEIGSRADDADLKAFALTNLGSLKIATGDTTDGFALMEEASIAAVNGELSPFTTGVTACRMIGACRDLTDYKRASEWIEATERYCDRQSLSGFPGVCRIHRAEVAAVGGKWETAEQELERATVELEAYNAVPPQADGFYAIGEIRRLKGDFEGAEAALREAHARGRSPQPALALVRLAEGKTKAAAAAINAAVADESWDRWARARLLPAQVEIDIAAGDVNGARVAVDELTEIVAGYPSPAMEAGRQVALGRVLIAEGDASGAIRELRAAIRGWRNVGSPYEVARARAVLSSALRALDSEDEADLELDAAVDEFRRLGARIDVEAAERVRRDVEDRRSGPVSARKTFMFTDIVDSTRLAGAMGDREWDRVLRLHDDLIRRSVADGGGEVVKTTGDGFFVVFESAREAVRCAVAIQRSLRDHRARSGFVPPVRIGLHTAEANRRGDDFSGTGVHVAARVAGLAGSGEIIISAATADEAGDIPTSDLRTVEVKGVDQPVDVATIAWAD